MSIRLSGRDILWLTLSTIPWMLPGVALSQQRTTSVEATRFAVTSGHPAATAAGIAVLESGGNVIDAAVTTSLALGVAAPYGSGLGGKLVMLYREGESGQVTCVEALPAAPRNLDPRNSPGCRFANSATGMRRCACRVFRRVSGRLMPAGGRCRGGTW